MACFLVTRPERDSLETAGRLRAMSHDTIIAPVIEIAETEGDALDLKHVQALLATSANGMRAFIKRQGGPVPKLKVLAVGDATARAAEQAGMDDVISANGDVDDLARLVIHHLSPAGGDLLHAAGSKIAGDLARMVAEAGFSYRREVLYEARPADNLTEAARAAIADHAVDGVLLYSPRTARLFTALVTGAGLGGACAGIKVVCLSPNVAAALADGGGEATVPVWRHIYTAGAPTEDALMALIKENF